ncbi:MAG: HAD family phosphatase [Verrucomicrobia bacterium]|nr:HAD family phosphatase [Verrucomicrobiota bacterium]
MNTVRLLSMDFDSTLVRDWASPAFPEELVSSILELKRRGVFFAINTGRSIALLEEGLALTGFPLRPDFALTLEREVFRWSGTAWEDFGSWNDECKAAHDRLFAQHSEVFLDIENYVQTSTQARLHYEAERFVGVVARSSAEMDGICRYIDSKAFKSDELDYQRNSIYLRFCHVAYHKGSALAELQRLLGIPAEETFASGDNFNDLPMLKLAYARFLACPSNAIEEVKREVRKQTGYIASEDSGFGVSQSLRYFFSHLLLS